MSCTYHLLNEAGCFIYNFQTLIAGLFALIAAFCTLHPVYRQLRLTQIQLSIASREALLDRVEVTARRRQLSAAELRTITDDFTHRLYQSDPEGEPDINSFWAHDAEQSVRGVIESLKRQQISKTDSQIVDDKRDAVIVAAGALEDCLRDIHQPDSIDLDDPDYGFTAEQIAVEEAKLDKACKAASEALVSRIDAVKEAAKSLDTEFEAVLAALRERVRQINELILKEDQPGR